MTDRASVSHITDDTRFDDLKARLDDLRYNLAIRAFTAPEADDETMFASLDARINDALTGGSEGVAVGCTAVTAGAPVSPVQATDHAGDRVSDDTNEGAAPRMARARQWIAHKGTGYIPPWDGLTPVQQEQAEMEARHWIRAAVNAGVKIVPAGCTVVALPEPDRRTPASSARWNASARRIVAKADQQGRPFVRVDGQIWLDGEAESVGLALVAAAREARRLAGSASPRGDNTDAAETWSCTRCGSSQWIGWRAGPAHEGFPRKAQCVPCGHVQDLPQESHSGSQVGDQHV